MISLQLITSNATSVHYIPTFDGGMLTLQASSGGDERLFVATPVRLSRMIGVSLVVPGGDSFRSVNRVRPLEVNKIRLRVILCDDDCNIPLTNLHIDIHKIYIQLTVPEALASP